MASIVATVQEDSVATGMSKTETRLQPKQRQQEQQEPLHVSLASVSIERSTWEDAYDEFERITHRLQAMKDRERRNESAAETNAWVTAWSIGQEQDDRKDADTLMRRAKELMPIIGNAAVGTIMRRVAGAAAVAAARQRVLLVK